MSTFSKLWIKLRDKAYRHAFVATQLKRGIPFQFRAMRKKLGLSQADLARLAGVSQGVISRAEDPDYGNLTFNTVLRIAKGMDCAFVGRVVPFSDLAKWFDNLSEESVQVPTFDEEDRAFDGLGTTVDYQYITAQTMASHGSMTPELVQVPFHFFQAPGGTIGDLVRYGQSSQTAETAGHSNVVSGTPIVTVGLPISLPASTGARATNSQLAQAA